MVRVIFDEDDYKWRVKPSKKPFSQEKSLKNNHVYLKHYSKLKESHSKESNHVVVKITGGAASTTSMKNHFDYISRNNKLTIIDNNEEELSLDFIKDEVKKEMEFSYGRKGSKKTYQIMFSTAGKNDPDLLKSVVINTMKKEFPNNKFYLVIHEDTLNTHAHVVLLRNSIETNKLIEIDKKKLNSLKKKYSYQLNKYGINSHFMSESDKRLKTSDKLKSERKNNNIYEVVDYGSANYKFKDDGKESYYLILKTKNGVFKEHWSLGLENEIKSKAVKIGDKITIKKVNKTSEYDNSFVRSTWLIDIKERTQNLNQHLKINSEFTVLDHGHANYKFNSDSKISYYFLLKDSVGKVTDLWAKELENFVKFYNIKKGDKVIIDKNQSLKKASNKQKISL